VITSLSEYFACGLTLAIVWAFVIGLFGPKMGIYDDQEKVNTALVGSVAFVLLWPLCLILLLIGLSVGLGSRLGKKLFKK
jgi:hypothetical protein